LSIHVRPRIVYVVIVKQIEVEWSDLKEGIVSVIPKEY
jgi:hypothetical protein